MSSCPTSADSSTFDLTLHVDIYLQVKLTQLDLSFNCISSICGLGNLTALQDLSLFSNNISSLEGLEPLSQLCALSMGKQPRCDSRPFGLPILNEEAILVLCLGYHQKHSQPWCMALQSPSALIARYNLAEASQWLVVDIRCRAQQDWLPSRDRLLASVPTAAACQHAG